MPSWPSGLRRYVQVVVSQEAWVQIPQNAYFLETHKAMIFHVLFVSPSSFPLLPPSSPSLFPISPLATLPLSLTLHSSSSFPSPCKNRCGPISQSCPVSTLHMFSLFYLVQLQLLLIGLKYLLFAAYSLSSNSCQIIGSVLNTRFTECHFCSICTTAVTPFSLSLPRTLFQ